MASDWFKVEGIVIGYVGVGGDILVVLDTDLNIYLRGSFSDWHFLESAIDVEDPTGFRIGFSTNDDEQTQLKEGLR